MHQHASCYLHNLKLIHLTNWTELSEIIICNNGLYQGAVSTTEGGLTVLHCVWMEIVLM